MSDPQGMTQAARVPFQFNSSAYLLRIGREKAHNLGEFLEALRTCPEESIFQHTFLTLQEHHFFRTGFTNDFAQWTFSACNEVALSEQLAGLDVRAFTSVAELRDQVLEIVSSYLAAHPLVASRAALTPFHFCASDMVVVPTPFLAHSVAEFIEDLQKVSVHSIHHHFIEARLRLKLKTNDFSVWLEEDAGMPKAAAGLNRIDIYTATLEQVRRQIVNILQASPN
ncbi:MAG TPA: DUF5752 family protein [Terriglobales bacterium]|nr:DUF5752 family protein [Terriglobales bacterium]